MSSVLAGILRNTDLASLPGAAWLLWTEIDATFS
jgi:hypothetical protein